MTCPAITSSSGSSSPAAGSDQGALEERGAERMDYFAMQLGRLEGIADALILAGRNVRLFPLPPLPWISVG